MFCDGEEERKYLERKGFGHGRRYEGTRSRTIAAKKFKGRFKLLRVEGVAVCHIGLQ